MKNDPGPQVIQNENDDAPTAAHNNNFGINSNYNTSNIPLDDIDDTATNTLALGYSFIDVQDEENEGKQSRDDMYSKSGGMTYIIIIISYCKVRCISIRSFCSRIHAFT